MNLNDIKATPLYRKRVKRVGRGTGNGKGRTCGRGNKGQNSRSGTSHPVLHEGGTMPLYRRLPKRGFDNSKFHASWVSFNLEQLNQFKPGDQITLETLVQSEIVHVNARDMKTTRCKLLGRGDLKVENLKITLHNISKVAREKLEQAKGTVEIIRFKPRKKKSRRSKS